MIFVTVGAQMAFDRLIEAVDRWAAETGRDDVFAQVGPTEREYEHIQTTRFLAPEAFKGRIQACRAVVGHAGMGTIISALQYGRPVLVLPRRADLRETRNDHQIATARKFAESGRIRAAYDAEELREQLDRIDRWAGEEAASRVSDRASEQLLERIRSFAFEQH